MTVRLDDAAEPDLPHLAAILSDWIDETPWMPRLHTRDENEGFLRMLAAGHVLRVARLNGAPAGFLARRDGEVDALYLAPGARGQGLGAALLAEAKAAEDALGLWTFQANVGARAFYARQGFAETRLTDGAENDERLPDVRLEWRR